MRFGNREEYRDAMASAIGRAQAAALAEKVIGGLTGWLARIFLTPLLTVYSWNRLTPDNFPDWQYLPVVAGFVVLHVVVGVIRGPRAS